MHIIGGEFIDRLSVFHRDPRVSFGSSEDALEFDRLKHRGKNIETGEELVRVEFNREVYRNASGTRIAEEVT